MVLDNFRTIGLIWDTANKSIIKTIKTASSDTTGRYLSVKILDGGQEVSLDEAKLQLYWEHPNFNTSGTDDFNTINSGGLFTMTFSDGMLTNIGKLNAHLVLILPDGKITSDGFAIEVIKGANDGVVVPTNGKGLVEQVARKIDKGDVTMDDLTQEVKLALTGGAVAVVGENSVGTENIIDGSVTVDKIAFFTHSKNLFNKNTVINEVVISIDGYETSNVQYATSDYIEVTPNKSYTTKEVYYISFYDHNKNFVSRYAAKSNELELLTLLTSSDVYFVRLSINKNAYDINTIQLNRGTVLLPYSDYENPKLKDVGVDLHQKQVKTEHLDNDSVTNEKVKDGEITSSKTDFIISSTNLFNKDTVIVGKVVSVDGTVVDNSAYTHSDFIKIENTSSYTVAGAHSIAFYDDEKNFITRRSSVGEELNLLTFIPVLNTKYIIININTISYDINKTQINKGAELLPYEPFGSKLSEEISLPIRRSDIIHDELFTIDGVVDGFYSSPIIPSTDVNNYTSDDFYVLFDELVTNHPGYVTKTLLGKDGSGTLDVYRYDFKPNEVDNLNAPIKIPKMILIGGVHYEKAGMYNLYQSMKQICELWEENELLETLRWNVHFIVVPVANPYGVNNITGRTVNGVNIARNFPPDWVHITEPTDSAYGGEEPLSEVETQYIDNIMSENRDAIYFTSFHNFFAPTDDNYFIWNASATQLQINLCKRLISKMSRKWKKEYEWLPQDNVTYFGMTGMHAPIASEGRNAARYGIQGSTFEVSQTFMLEPNATAFSSIALTLGVETFINWLLLNLKYNIDYYNGIM